MKWTKRAPAPHGEGAEGEIELRQLFELEDFGPSEAIDRARELEKELANKKEWDGNQQSIAKGVRYAIEPLFDVRWPMRSSVKILCEGAWRQDRSNDDVWRLANG